MRHAYANHTLHCPRVGASALAVGAPSRCQSSSWKLFDNRGHALSSIDGLDRWSEIGARILLIHDEAQAERGLNDWIAGVAAWISAVAANTGLQAAWFSEQPILVYGTAIEQCRMRVRHRLAWLTRFPSEFSHKQTMDSLTTIGRRGGLATQSPGAAVVYVDPSRITELRQLTGLRFSTVKLVRLCEELNACLANESYLAAIMLLRSIIDHVPPIFACQNFDQVVSQTNGRSFNAQLNRLNSQAKDVANRFLHDPIGPTQALPKLPQVEFRSELDALLGEVVARLRAGTVIPPAPGKTRP